MAVIDGDILAGYGDWFENTGPIHVESVAASAPLSAWVSKVVVSTEQVSVFRKLTDGRVVIPHVDPQGPGVGYAERVGSVWTDRAGRISATTGQHVLDMVEFGGRLWACGSDGDDSHDYAVVWHSADGGATWVESLRDPVSVVGSRFYFFATVGDHLWVRNAEQGHTFVWTAADGWTSQDVEIVPSVETGAAGQPWAGGTLIPSGLQPGAGPAFFLYLIDGSPAAFTVVASQVSGWSVGDDGNLYVLNTARRILRISPTTPTVSSVLVELDDIGVSYRSLAMLPGSTSAVAGTTDSRLALIDLT